MWDRLLHIMLCIVLHVLDQKAYLGFSDLFWKVSGLLVAIFRFLMKNAASITVHMPHVIWDLTSQNEVPGPITRVLGKILKLNYILRSHVH